MWALSRVSASGLYLEKPEIGEELVVEGDFKWLSGVSVQQLSISCDRSLTEVWDHVPPSVRSLKLNGVFAKHLGLLQPNQTLLCYKSLDVCLMSQC